MGSHVEHWSAEAVADDDGTLAEAVRAAARSSLERSDIVVHFDLPRPQLIPAELCGIDGCTYLPHGGPHTWQR